jgi:hypothetical protein
MLGQLPQLYISCAASVSYRVELSKWCIVMFAGNAVNPLATSPPGCRARCNDRISEVEVRSISSACQQGIPVQSR